MWRLWWFKILEMYTNLLIFIIYKNSLSRINTLYIFVKLLLRTLSKKLNILLTEKLLVHIGD